MSALITTTDIGTGWLIIAAVLILCGMGIIALVRSSWSERCARKAEHIITSPAPFRHHAQTSVFSDDIERHNAEALHIANAMDRIEPEPLSLVAPVINFPTQRDGSGH